MLFSWLAADIMNVDNHFLPESYAPHADEPWTTGIFCQLLPKLPCQLNVSHLMFWYLCLNSTLNSSQPSEKGLDEIVFKAMGRAINKIVMIVELIKAEMMLCF
ncbi:uncharacterized protein LOC131229643 [Magnolia sinica]|uniref:uncharacterized protein LOC131229643 n=1 Tax=Magnolia sinica TaxID=86752 RepID=UPI00265B2C69|nr:uncharacterized protein LOC131229643 [Magnolia sinica]